MQICALPVEPVRTRGDVGCAVEVLDSQLLGQFQDKLSSLAVCLAGIRGVEHSTVAHFLLSDPAQNCSVVFAIFEVRPKILDKAAQNLYEAYLNEKLLSQEYHEEKLALEDKLEEAFKEIEDLKDEMKFNKNDAKKEKH